MSGRYIDADELIVIGLDDPDCEHQFKFVPWEFIEDAPTADVVEVVRCRDCTWWKSIFSWNGKEHKVCVRDSSEPPREQNDFCSYAERKKDGEANTLDIR